jgi:hypothetical protein
MKCSEPYEWFYIRDEILIQDGHDYYNEVKKNGRDFSDLQFKFTRNCYIEECPACYGKKVKRDEKSEVNAEAREALADVLGDDVDGFMAECEDFGL